MLPASLATVLRSSVRPQLSLESAAAVLTDAAAYLGAPRRNGERTTQCPLTVNSKVPPKLFAVVASASDVNNPRPNGVVWVVLQQV